jgi:hypothetical protein
MWYNNAVNNVELHDSEKGFYKKAFPVLFLVLTVACGAFILKRCYLSTRERARKQNK